MLLQRMQRLETRERTVLELRYGLEGGNHDVKEIGRLLGVTREWVRKIEIRALASSATSRAIKRSVEDWEAVAGQAAAQIGLPASAVIVQSPTRHVNSGDPAG